MINHVATGSKRFCTEDLAMGTVPAIKVNQHEYN